MKIVGNQDSRCSLILFICRFSMDIYASFISEKYFFSTDKVDGLTLLKNHFV